MDRMYINHPESYGASPMSFASVPDLVSCTYDDDTDPCPSPPVVSHPHSSSISTPADTSYPQPYPTMDNYQYNPYHLTPPTSCTDYMTPQPTIVNSIEFTDLTQIQHEERLRGQRRSNAAQDKEAASNMRIRRRAQNRASQRAFRERKEKHVQQLEHQLEELETKHRELSQSYSNLDNNHQELKRESDKLRQELDAARNGGRSPSVSRSNSLKPGTAHDEWTATGGAAGQSVKQETESDAFFDPFCGSNGGVTAVEHSGDGIEFFHDGGGQGSGNWPY